LRGQGRGLFQASASLAEIPTHLDLE